MRVCDRHPRKKAEDAVHITSSDEQFDVCKECSEQILRFFQNPKQDAVEPKKKRRLGFG